MIPFPLEEEKNPPLKVSREAAFTSLGSQRFDLVVVGATPVAREVARLASHNSLKTAIICTGDFVDKFDSGLASNYTQRLALSELLSARYDGAVDLNHLTVIAIDQQLGSELRLTVSCRLTGQRITVRCGAVINESEKALGRLTAPARITPWIGKIVTEQRGVFRYAPGRIIALKREHAAVLLLKKILECAEDSRPVAALTDVPLIDALNLVASQIANPESSGLRGIVEKKNSSISAHADGVCAEFIKQCEDLQINLLFATRAINRFGSRVALLSKLPSWNEVIHPEILRGEFHLALATELPISLDELLVNRLGISPLSTASNYSGTQDDFPELAALFQELQHVNTL